MCQRRGWGSEKDGKKESKSHSRACSFEGWWDAGAHRKSAKTSLGRNANNSWLEPAFADLCSHCAIYAVYVLHIAISTGSRASRLCFNTRLVELFSLCKWADVEWNICGWSFSLIFTRSFILSLSLSRSLYLIFLLFSSRENILLHLDSWKSRIL